MFKLSVGWCHPWRTNLRASYLGDNCDNGAINKSVEVWKSVSGCLRNYCLCCVLKLQQFCHHDKARVSKLKLLNTLGYVGSPQKKTILEKKFLVNILFHEFSHMIFYLRIVTCYNCTTSFLTPPYNAVDRKHAAWLMSQQYLTRHWRKCLSCNLKHQDYFWKQAFGLQGVSKPCHALFSKALQW